MKQVILAAGKGTRLKLPVTNKCLATVSGKTLIDHNLELSSEINASEIIIIVGYNKEPLIENIGSSYNGIPIKYVEQEPQLGIAHGIMKAATNIKESFLMCLSDEVLVSNRVNLCVDFFNKTTADCVCGIVRDTNENISKAYTVKFDGTGLITDIMEKPRCSFNEFKGTGYCVMRSSMLEILPYLQKNPQRGEYEMGDWIRLAIQRGMSCYAFEIGNADFNINELSDLKKAEEYINKEV